MGEDFKTVLDGAVNTIVACAKKVDEKITVLAEKEATWKTIVETMDEKTAAAKSKIVLDVGGTRFATTKATLLKHKDSFFADMFATGYATEEDGSYFIDRSPKYFSVIMDFLRYDELPDFDAWTSVELERLKKEFEFFKIPAQIAPKYSPSDVIFASGSKQATIATTYTVNKGTLLQNGRHTWTVRIDNMVASTDVGVVAPSHTTHFNNSTKTAWGIRNSGYAHYTPNTKQFAGFKTGDTIKLELDLSAGTLRYWVNDKKLGFEHTDVVGPVHVAFSGGQNAATTIIS